LAKAPEDAQRHVLLGVALAYLGKKAEAGRAGEQGVALSPSTKYIQHSKYIQHQLVRIHILTGNHEKALDLLELLLKTPHTLTAGWLRIDPNFDPLRGNPRFEKLAHGT